MIEKVIFQFIYSWIENETKRMRKSLLFMYRLVRRNHGTMELGTYTEGDDIMLRKYHSSSLK